MAVWDKAGPAGRAPEAAPDWRSPDFVEELRSRVAGAAPGSLLAGSITLIGLDRIKERMGGRWTAIADRADRLARKTIARYLAPGDIYTAWRETNYIIVFGSLGEAQAQIKCRLIAAEVAKALLGEDGVKDLDVKHAIATIDGGLALAEMPSIAALVDSALVASDMVPAGEEEAGHPGAQPSAPAANAPTASAPAASARVSATVASVVHFIFRPVWDPTLNALSTYRCLAVGAAEPHGGEPFRETTEVEARIDFAALKRVLAELAAMKRDGRKLLLVLPVQFETLAGAAMRRSYIEALADGARDDVTKLLVVEMVGVPRGIPHSRLIELSGPLRRHCRSVVARVAIEVGDLTAFKGSGLHAVGCELGAGTSELLQMQLMGRFQHVAERADLATYIRGLRSHSLAAAALGAGYRYLEGDGIAKAVARPEAVREFRLFDVYRPLVEA